MEPFPISHYFALALPLTILTAWIIFAFQSKYTFPAGTGFWKRLAWLFHNMISKKTLQQKRLNTLNPILYDPFVAIYIFHYFYWVGYVLIYYGDISTEEP
jgi:hypothetical protein